MSTNLANRDLTLLNGLGYCPVFDVEDQNSFALLPLDLAELISEFFGSGDEYEVPDSGLHFSSVCFAYEAAEQSYTDSEIIQTLDQYKYKITVTPEAEQCGVCNSVELAQRISGLLGQLASDDRFVDRVNPYL